MCTLHMLITEPTVNGICFYSFRNFLTLMQRPSSFRKQSFCLCPAFRCIDTFKLCLNFVHFQLNLEMSKSPSNFWVFMKFIMSKEENVVAWYHAKTRWHFSCSVWPAQVIQSTWVTPESSWHCQQRRVPMGVIAKIGYSHTAQ